MLVITRGYHDTDNLQAEVQPMVADWKMTCFGFFPTQSWMIVQGGPDDLGNLQNAWLEAILRQK